jgi:hypothetical protein
LILEPLTTTTEGSNVTEKTTMSLVAALLDKVDPHPTSQLPSQVNTIASSCSLWLWAQNSKY